MLLTSRRLFHVRINLDTLFLKRKNGRGKRKWNKRRKSFLSEKGGNIAVHRRCLVFTFKRNPFAFPFFHFPSNIFSQFKNFLLFGTALKNDPPHLCRWHKTPVTVTSIRCISFSVNKSSSVDVVNLSYRYFVNYPQFSKWVHDTPIGLVISFSEKFLSAVI